MLVFTIQQEHFHQLILDALKQGFYFFTPFALGQRHLLPDQSPVAQFGQKQFDVGQQMCSFLVEFPGLIIRVAG